MISLKQHCNQAHYQCCFGKEKQMHSFCGINAHFQNGKAEKRIRDLQDNARTMLLHAQRMWEDAITINLWPYALQMANDIHNSTPHISKDQSPLEQFTNVAVQPMMRNFHHFGCPVYVLNNQLQAGQKGCKWEEHAQVGVYLGHSPQHACSIVLILSLKMGLVSPQFHCSFDDLFKTALQPGTLPTSFWQRKTYFRREATEIQVGMKQSMDSMPPNAAPPKSDQQESEDIGQLPENMMIEGNNEPQ